MEIIKFLVAHEIAQDYNNLNILKYFLLLLLNICNSDMNIENCFTASKAL